ncbi:MAG: hypothetical protein R3B40_15310 [Polyangiales bacterium]|nr:hypothetical protein [Myxococcales bacterium]MCB9658329.1 hypothetical protein [Sandaracinaceae bacterium]
MPRPHVTALVACFALASACHDSDTRIVATLSCERAFDATTTMTYQVVDWSDGSTFVSCTFSDDELTTSTAYFFVPQQFGAERAECPLTYDLDEPSGGTWNFRAMPSPEATYSDPGSPLDGLVEAFEPEDCVTIPHNDGVRVDRGTRAAP